MKVFIFLLLLFSTSPKKDIYPQVYVKWVDIIATDSGWHTKEEIEEWEISEPDTVTQTGFIYKETKDYVILIDSYITEDYVGAATKIPKANIVLFERNKH